MIIVCIVAGVVILGITGMIFYSLGRNDSNEEWNNHFESLRDRGIF